MLPVVYLPVISLLATVVLSQGGTRQAAREQSAHVLQAGIVGVTDLRDFDKN